MTPPRRLVSVIVATRDRPALLAEALASIRALESEDLGFEIIVGDNGTAPESESVAQRFGAIYEKTEKNGCAAARNLALARASGEFIAFLDDDDVWLPGHIRPHIALLDARPDMEAVFGQIISTDQERRPIGKIWPAELPDDGELFEMLLGGYFPQVGANLVRARALRTHGLMDETLIGDCDWDWHLRIARAHKIGFAPAPCVLFRQRPPGSFDALQLRRAGFTRRIFFRHAPEYLKRVKSPFALLHVYRGALDQYFDYFIAAADRAIQEQDYRIALRALSSAFAVFPFRTLKRVVFQAPLRKAVIRGVFSSSTQAASAAS